MIRVWFNHWFSTSYRLIQLIKDNETEDVWVVGSNSQKNSVIQLVCDEWYEDSCAKGQEYVDFCLKFCREHRIDVFVPRREMVAISHNKDRFETAGTKVLVDDFEKIDLLNDKVRTYKLFENTKNINVPNYFLVNSAQQFEEAYNKLRQKYGQVCAKFVKDEGAMSYRRIVENEDSFDRLRMYQGAEIGYKRYMAMLSTRDKFDSLMVMPYLSGSEISVDCLMTDTGLIEVLRIKSNSRHEFIKYDKNILDMAETVIDKTGLEYPCNIQFKESEGIPYLLEVNTRMSGGLQMTCMATGINIPNLALNKALGRKLSWKNSREEHVVSYIEIPKIII